MVFPAIVALVVGLLMVGQWALVGMFAVLLVLALASLVLMF